MKKRTQKIETDPTSVVEGTKDYEQHRRHVDRMVLQLGAMRHATDRAYREQRDSRNLNDKDMAALAYLSQEWKEGRTAAPKDVASHLGLSSATTTSVLDRLEGDGYLKRCPSTVDRRGVRLVPADALQDWLVQHPSEILRTSFLEIAAEMNREDVGIIDRYFSAVLQDLQTRLSEHTRTQ